jgi:hypothetical protein
MISLNKNIFSSKTKKGETVSTIFGQEISENLPIFTMKSDLANLSNPDLNDFKNKPVTKQAQASTELPEISQKQNNGPFLNHALPTEVEKGKIKPAEKLKKEANWEKLILISIVCFLFLAVGAGGYYYWISRENKQNKETIKLPPPPNEEALTFSIEKPNYLPLDIDASDSTKIKEDIKKYVARVANSGSLTPIEFVITDLKNNPLNFPLFASKMGINFSQDLISNLNTEAKFSLFIYNDIQKTRLGLVVDSVDDYKLKKVLFQEEADLVKELDPLFLDITYDSEIKSFGSSSYDNMGIRYINLTALGDLTVDYTIFENKLIIGTTKMTIRSVMDYIKSHSQINSNEGINVSNTALESD